MAQINHFSLLYAEDDELIRKGYTHYFETIFEKVYSAVDGREAYSLYNQHKPDILIFDVKMPYINGLDLAKKIREKNKDVKIIILTAHIDEQKLLQAIPLNLVNYLEKPVKKRELENVIMSLVSDLQLNSENSSLINILDTMVWNRDKNLLLKNNQKVHLTKNEIIMLNILSNKPIIHHSIDNLLEEFWQYQYQKEMSYDSIRNIIKRLKQKLSKESIENHYSIGYKLSIKV